jgi:hypothetical protein
VHGGDGQYVGVGGGQGDHLVVAGADPGQVALPGLVGAAEPHGADAGQFQPGGVDLVAVFAQGSFAVAQVDVHVEHGRGGQGGGRGQAKQQEQRAQHASSHNKGMGAWCHGCAGEGSDPRRAAATRLRHRGARGRIRRRAGSPCPSWGCIGVGMDALGGAVRGVPGAGLGMPGAGFEPFRLSRETFRVSHGPFWVSRGPF